MVYNIYPIVLTVVILMLGLVLLLLYSAYGLRSYIKIISIVCIVCSCIVVADIGVSYLLFKYNLNKLCKCTPDVVYSNAYSVEEYNDYYDSITIRHESIFCTYTKQVIIRR